MSECVGRYILSISATYTLSNRSTAKRCGKLNRAGLNTTTAALVAAEAAEAVAVAVVEVEAVEGEVEAEEGAGAI